MSSPQVFTAAPVPNTEIGALLATVSALKANVDLLTGQSANGAYAALTTADFNAVAASYGAAGAAGVAGLPKAAAIAGAFTQVFHNDQNIRDALRELQYVIPVQIDNAIVGARAEVQAALDAFHAQSATADTVINATITTLTATVGANTAAITAEAVTRATDDSALSGTIATVAADTATNAAAITSEVTARTTADTALAATVTALTATVDANLATLTTESATRASADTALSGTITTLTATVGTNLATLTTESATRASADSAMSGQITTVTATANQATAGGQIRFIATAGGTTGVGAEYSVEVYNSVGAQFVHGGFRLQALNDGTARVVYDVDEFVIRGAANTLIVPFQVVGGAVYINTAFIRAATIDSAMIDHASITSLTSLGINASQITAGTINASQMTAGTITAASGIIASLAIDTLQLASNAVTVPLTASWSGSEPGDGATHTLMTSNMTITGVAGQSITIAVTAKTAQNMYGPGQAGLYLIINGVTVDEGRIWVSSGGPIYGLTCIVVGSFTYTCTGTDVIPIRIDWNGNVGQVVSASFIATAAKR